jgi:hypothetical protein
VAVAGGLVVVAALVVALVVRTSSDGTAPPAAPAPASVVSKVTGLPASVMTAVGLGSAAAPKPLTAPPLSKDGKPLVLYIGAEYCPFCAAERWPMVIALSRFGTLADLGLTHSSGTDVYPNTPTFSFHGAGYQSPYLAFEGVELEGNELSGGRYPDLDVPTPAQKAIFDTYDAPPYVAVGAAGSIPFVDLGGRYLVSGATYSPAVLAGRTADEIATQLADPSTPVSQGAVGAANAITAAICRLTGGQPVAVCADRAVDAIAQTLGP